MLRIKYDLPIMGYVLLVSEPYHRKYQFLPGVKISSKGGGGDLQSIEKHSMKNVLN
ncbi:hypothetical protein [Chryseobacterium elymi]|uniref:hypothetical protein n=1 Tax=Chryseobacterium elymi TaxID=395936 RepID=UPI0013008C73|nr:hypothetical protein [Chryseobacterium elymi]